MHPGRELFARRFHALALEIRRASIHAAIVCRKCEQTLAENARIRAARPAADEPLAANAAMPDAQLSDSVH